MFLDFNRAYFITVSSASKVKDKIFNTNIKHKYFIAISSVAVVVAAFIVQSRIKKHRNVCISSGHKLQLELPDLRKEVYSCAARLFFNYAGYKEFLLEQEKICEEDALRFYSGLICITISNATRLSRDLSEESILNIQEKDRIEHQGDQGQRTHGEVLKEIERMLQLLDDAKVASKEKLKEIQDAFEQSFERVTKELVYYKSVRKIIHETYSNYSKYMDLKDFTQSILDLNKRYVDLKEHTHPTLDPNETWGSYTNFKQYLANFPDINKEDKNILVFKFNLENINDIRNRIGKLEEMEKFFLKEGENIKYHTQKYGDINASNKIDFHRLDRIRVAAVIHTSLLEVLATNHDLSSSTDVNLAAQSLGRVDQSARVALRGENKQAADLALEREKNYYRYENFFKHGVACIEYKREEEGAFRYATPIHEMIREMCRVEGEIARMKSAISIKNLLKVGIGISSPGAEIK